MSGTFTEDNEESLSFRHQRPCFAKASHGTAKQGLLGNLVRANTRRFVAFVAFCKNCFGENTARPAVTPYPGDPSHHYIILS
jgi:hypothetical protein